MRSFKSNDNIQKKEGGSYYISGLCFTAPGIWQNNNINILKQSFTWDPVFKIKNCIRFIASEYIMVNDVAHSVSIMTLDIFCKKIIT